MSDQIAGAVIALAGVVVGTIIPALFAMRRYRREDERLLREHVTKFCHHANRYLRFVPEVRAARDKDIQHSAHGNGEVSRRYWAATESGYAVLGACHDADVAAKADSILESIIAYSDGHKDLFESAAKGPWPDNAPIIASLRDLLDMVSPRERWDRVRVLKEALRPAPVQQR